MHVQVTLEISTTETKILVRIVTLSYINAFQVGNILYLETKYSIQEDTM